MGRYWEGGGAVGREKGKGRADKRVYVKWRLNTILHKYPLTSVVQQGSDGIGILTNSGPVKWGTADGVRPKVNDTLKLQLYPSKHYPLTHFRPNHQQMWDALL